MPGSTGYMADQQGDTDTNGRRRNERKNDGGGVLERVTVNLSMRASRALELIIKLTGDTKTDAINRALQVYAFVEETSAAGGALYIREGEDAPLQMVKIF